MNKQAQAITLVLGVLVLGYIALKTPAPMSKEQIEFDEAVFTAQRLKLNHKCENALDILETLKDEYPSTSIYLEYEGDGCYAQLKQYDKMFDSCLNSKLTEYMPARAAICSKQLADAGRFDDALLIWDKDIQDKSEEIFPYSQINRYEQQRNKLNMKIKDFISHINSPLNLTAELRNNYLGYIYYKKGDYDKALEYALNGSSNQLKGKIYLAKGDFTKAEEFFAKETNPIKKLENEGLAAFYKKDYKTAKAKFNELSKVNPSSTKPFEQLGEIALIQKDYVSARKYFQRILNLESYNANAKEKLKKLK